MSDKLGTFLPQPVKFELLHGKSATVSPMTLEHAIQAEEVYGSMNKFIEVVTSSKGGALASTEALFMMLENKGDFADARDFAKHLPIALLERMRLVAAGIAHASAVETTRSSGEGDNPEGK